MDARDRVCFDCDLDDCVESDPGCRFWEGRQTPNQRYYAKMRLDPEWRKRMCSHDGVHTGIFIWYGVFFLMEV
jgi:hypothetical protein